MVELKPGARFQSTVCTTEVIVVKGAGEADLTCGGAPMVEAGTAEVAGEPSCRRRRRNAPRQALLRRRTTRSSCLPRRRAPARWPWAAPRWRSPEAKTLPASD